MTQASRQHEGAATAPLALWSHSSAGAAPASAPSDVALCSTGNHPPALWTMGSAVAILLALSQLLLPQAAASLPVAGIDEGERAVLCRHDEPLAIRQYAAQRASQPAAPADIQPCHLPCAAAVVRRLRATLHEAGESPVWHGWMRLNDTSHPCRWSGVTCAANGSITSL